MKRIMCEVCGSNELVKEDSFFVCQYCGARYSLTDIKALFDAAKIDISGSKIKIDETEKRNNLYNLAKRAKAEGNIENAAKYYGELIKMDSNDWEANFYSVFYDSLKCTINDIQNSIYKISNVLNTTISLIKQSSMNSTETMDAVIEIVNRTNDAAQLFINNSYNDYYSIDKVIRHIYQKDMLSRCFNAILLQKQCGDLLYENFKYMGNQKIIDIINKYAVLAYKSALSNLTVICKEIDKEKVYKIVQETKDRILCYESSYKLPNELVIFSKIGSLKKWLKNN